MFSDQHFAHFFFPKPGYTFSSRDLPCNFFYAAARMQLKGISSPVNHLPPHWQLELESVPASPLPCAHTACSPAASGRRDPPRLQPTAPPPQPQTPARLENILTLLKKNMLPGDPISRGLSRLRRALAPLWRGPRWPRQAWAALHQEPPHTLQAAPHQIPLKLSSCKPSIFKLRMLKWIQTPRNEREIGSFMSYRVLSSLLTNRTIFIRKFQNS